MHRERLPIPDAILDYLEPVKPYLNSDPIEKEDLIERVAGRVERPVINFLKRFSFMEIRKTDDDRLIVV
jgi:hypothetical protein